MLLSDKRRKLDEVTLTGKDGKDAKLYLEKLVDTAIKKLNDLGPNR